MSKKLVLCVDDHQDSISFMSTWLSLQGYEVRAVDSCTEALEVVQSNQVALSILDAHLADGDGFDLCKHILAKSPSTKVILNSGDTRPEMKNQAKEVGAKAFFGKPIPLEQMGIVIHELIG